jgi:hypothetical protein
MFFFLLGIILENREFSLSNKSYTTEQNPRAESITHVKSVSQMTNHKLNKIIEPDAQQPINIHCSSG